VLCEPAASLSDGISTLSNAPPRTRERSKAPTPPTGWGCEAIDLPMSSARVPGA
jgi:hypothetical protein